MAKQIRPTPFEKKTVIKQLFAILQCNVRPLLASKISLFERQTMPAHSVLSIRHAGRSTREVTIWPLHDIATTDIVCVWHTQGGSVWGRILHNGRAIVLQ